MECSDKSTTVHGASCPGEIILGNTFLVHSGLNVTSLVAENIAHLSSLDYGDLHSEKKPTNMGRLGIKLLSDNIEPSVEFPEALSVGG